MAFTDGSNNSNAGNPPNTSQGQGPDSQGQPPEHTPMDVGSYGDDFPFDPNADDGESPDPELDDLLAAFDDAEGNESAQDAAARAAAEAAAQRNRQETQVGQLQSEIQSAIRGATVPDSVFGEDFDPTDANSVKQAMNGVLQHAMTQSVALALRPMNAALGNVRDVVMNEVRNEIQNSQQSQTEEAQLVALAPVLGNSESRKVLTPILEHLRGQKKSVQDQAKVINSFAQKLGLNKRATGRSAQTSDGDMIRTGSSALSDLFGS